jgi:hypothetical protein
MQGASPIVEGDTLTNKMGYICQYIIDADPNNGNIIPIEDGRGFFYEPNTNFEGSDYVSYRVINSMGQSSEPQCIYFKVDKSIKVNGLIVEPVIKLSTVILHNGNSDVFNERTSTTDTVLTRTIYAFNVLPNSYYALYEAGIQGLDWVSVSIGVENWGHSQIPVNKLIGVYKTGESGEFEVLTFDTPVGFSSMGIPSDWLTNPPHASGYGYFPYVDLHFVLSPVGDARLLAADSNRLKLNYYDAQPYIDKGLPFPEDSPSISPDIAKLITKSNVAIDLVNSDNKRKLLLLANGRDIVATPKSIATGRTIDLLGKTASTALTQTYNVTNTSYINPTFIEFNRSVEYELPPQYNSSDGTVTKGSAKLFDIVFDICNLPTLADNLALFAYVTDPSALLTNTNFKIYHLQKDSVTGEYSVDSNNFTGFVLIHQFPRPNVEVAPLKNGALNGQVTLTFSSNTEYMSTNQNSVDATTGVVNYIPIDVTKIAGFVAMSCTVESNKALNNSLMSNYLPVSANTATGYVYKDVASALYDSIYLGSPENAQPPSIPTSSELQLFRKNTIQVPSALLLILRNNTLPYRITWRIVDVSTEDSQAVQDPTVLASYVASNADKVMSKSVLNNAEHYIVGYEYIYGDSQHISGAYPEEYPEVVSVHIKNKVDNYTNQITNNAVASKFALIVDYDRNNASDIAMDVSLKILDCKHDTSLYVKSVNFDGADANQHLYLGTLESDASGTLTFTQVLKPYADA